MIPYISKVDSKEYKDKTCVLTVDLNVLPGEKLGSFRVKKTLPTIKFLLKTCSKIVILSHRGKDKELTLRPFVKFLSQELKEDIVFLPDFNFEKNKKQISGSRKRVFLMENLRFHKGEKKNSKQFSKSLALLGDFFVNEAFSVSHRDYSSISGIAGFLPSYGGLVLEEEIENLSSIGKRLKKPFVVIIGGLKVHNKLSVLSFFWRKADHFLLGSGPATTFFAAEGLPVGDSFVDEDSIPKIRKFVGSEKLVLPLDVNVKKKQILDIGERTIDYYSRIISKAKTIIWSGPVGFFEEKEFAGGTKAIWKAILKNKKAQVVVGGGETLESLRLARKSTSSLPKNIFLSTGGGAMLEYLSGQKLPGVEVLKK